jgi:hypothetical protein
MALIEYYRDWLEHHDKTVKIDGVMHRLDVRSHNAIYPYKHTAISVHAIPVNRRSKHYKETKQVLGDHWSIDVLESDVTIQTAILTQLVD